uniref:Uncharacterized protein n=1 Tax=Anguilla anguilla TaxID=7936 RepID=A0A0E9QMX8_ANGAN
MQYYYDKRDSLICTIFQYFDMVLMPADVFHKQRCLPDT